MREVLAITEQGASRTRTAIFGLNGRPLGAFLEHQTDSTNYQASITLIGDTLGKQARKFGGRIVAGSMAIAAEVNTEGVLTRAGALSCVGERPGVDLTHALDLPEGSVSVMNDIFAAAKSQQHINAQNGRFVDGVALTLSSGFNNAYFFADGCIQPRETGHDYYKEGATCACGKEGCYEAHISGKGIKRNRGLPSEEWLQYPLGQGEFIGGVSAAAIAIVERDRAGDLNPEELRWTGGVALGQPFLMQRVADNVRNHFGPTAPVFETATMGEHAGLHGALLDAQAHAMAA